MNINTLITRLRDIAWDFPPEHSINRAADMLTVLQAENNKLQDELRRREAEIARLNEAREIANEKADAANKLYDHCRQKGIQIEILINNAGIFSFQEITRTDPKKIETMLQLHIGTVTRLSRLFAADMCNRKHGYILNMSSLSCWTPYPGIALYTATKAYIRVFTRALGYELRDYGVVATVVCPGGVATGLYGLKPGLLKLGVRLGVLMTTEHLVRKALKALFRGKKQLIPGVFNRLLIPLASVMPTSIRLFVKHRLLDE